MKRILLFIATNLAVLVVMSVILSLLGVDRFLTRSGLNLPMLLVFSLVVGFTGSIISLLMSKSMAKWSTGARVIETPMNGTEAWLLQTVGKLAQRAGIGMPEVAVYDGEPNAFATGAFRDSALVAVSTGLLQGMTQDEVEAVLGNQPAMEPLKGGGEGEKLSASVAKHLKRYFDLHGGALPPAGVYQRILREVELPLIEIALDATAGNQAKCADLLGINRNTLRKKITDLDIRVTRRRKLM
jgi:DNA-binding protein Fis